MNNGSPLSIEEGAHGAGLDWRELLHSAREKWWVIALTTLVCAALGAAYLLHSKACYQARAVLQVGQEERNLLGVADASREDMRGADVLNTIVQNIKNTSVLLRVVEANHLDTDVNFLPGNTNQLTQAKLAGSLASMVTVKLRPETRLIDIVVTHANADEAQKLANSITQEFIRQTMEEHFSTAKAANELLLGEAARLKVKLEESEKKVQAYKEENKNVSLEERQNIVVEKLKALNQKYSEARAERLQLEGELTRVKLLTNNPEALLSLPIVLQDGAASDLRRKYVALQAEVATLSLRYKPRHPKMIVALRELDDLRTTLNRIAMQAPEWLQASCDNAAVREKNLEAGLKDVQLESLALDSKEIQYNVLLRDVESDRALYESVLKKLKETDVSAGLENTGLSIAESAAKPSVPLRPSSALIMFATSIIGLLAGFGILAILKIIDGSIRTVDQAEGLLSLPVLAAMPLARAARNGVPPHVLVEEPASMCSEGFRTLRTTAGLLLRAGGKKVVLFTSADPGEGKTFCSLNHAICQAQEGKKTLLIDLDLRRPAVGQSFGMKSETPGVVEYLAGADSLDALVRSTVYPNLFVLPAGKNNQTPAEQLGHEALEQLIADARREYDRIILDTPPINAVSDGLLLLHLADVICLVVRTGRTPRRAITRAIELMARAEFPPSGIVLNFLPEHSGFGCYYHYAPKASYYREGVYCGNGNGNGHGKVTLTIGR